MTSKLIRVTVAHWIPVCMLMQSTDRYRALLLYVCSLPVHHSCIGLAKPLSHSITQHDKTCMCIF